MKRFPLSLLLMFMVIAHTYGQVREIVFIDSQTEAPVPDVNIFNPETLEGAISNGEGRAKIPDSSSSLVVSHIAYEGRELLRAKDFGRDTIFLLPKAFALNEVLLHDLNLKKKLQYVLDHYEELYAVDSKTFDCTYKERLEVNHALTRLSQVQLKWWNKKYELDFGKSLEKQNQFSLTATDYSRVVEEESILSTSGFIGNNYLLQYIHLNYYPILLTSYGKDFHVKSVEKYAEHTRIIFDGKIEIDGKLVSHLKDSRIYFDDSSGAITKVELRMIYQDNLREDVSREKGIPYTSRVETHNLELSFSKHPSGRLIPASFHSTTIGEVAYEGKVDEIEMQQSMYITRTGKDDRIRRRDRIDLSDPFYEYFPTNEGSGTKMLLTREEEVFLNAKTYPAVEKDG